MRILAIRSVSLIARTDIPSSVGLSFLEGASIFAPRTRVLVWISLGLAEINRVRIQLGIQLRELGCVVKVHHLRRSTDSLFLSRREVEGLDRGGGCWNSLSC